MRDHEQTEQPVQLHDDKTLIGYGRRQHGLNGKDADLDYGGQNAVEETWWFDGYIQITGRRYASIVPPGNTTADDDAYHWELVATCGYEGEWDGDYWVIGEPYSLNVPFTEYDDSDDVKAQQQAVKAAYDAIRKDSREFEETMTNLAKQIEVKE